jgi:hypothetical protein
MNDLHRAFHLAIRWLVREIRVATKPPRRPASIRLRVVSEDESMAGVLNYDVIIDLSNQSPDVVRGELTVEGTSSGEPFTETITVAPDQGSVTGLMGDQDSQVNLSFVWVDDADNQSESVGLSATLKDTIPPNAPGGLGITVTGEA